MKHSFLIKFFFCFFFLLLSVYTPVSFADDQVSVADLQASLAKLEKVRQNFLDTEAEMIKFHKRAKETHVNNLAKVGGKAVLDAAGAPKTPLELGVEVAMDKLMDEDAYIGYRNENFDFKSVDTGHKTILAMTKTLRKVLNTKTEEELRYFDNDKKPWQYTTVWWRKGFGLYPPDGEPDTLKQLINRKGRILVGLSKTISTRARAEADLIGKQIDELKKKIAGIEQEPKVCFGSWTGVARPTEFIYPTDVCETMPKGASSCVQNNQVCGSRPASKAMGEGGGDSPPCRKRPIWCENCAPPEQQGAMFYISLARDVIADKFYTSFDLDDSGKPINFADNKGPFSKLVSGKAPVYETNGPGNFKFTWNKLMDNANSNGYLIYEGSIGDKKSQGTWRIGHPGPGDTIKGSWSAEKCR